MELDVKHALPWLAGESNATQRSDILEEFRGVPELHMIVDRIPGEQALEVDRALRSLFMLHFLHDPSGREVDGTAEGLARLGEIQTRVLEGGFLLVVRILRDHPEEDLGDWGLAAFGRPIREIGMD